MRALGARRGVQDDWVEIDEPGRGQFQAPSEALDAGNSGTAMRLLSGILAGQDFECQIKGDASLSQRPTKRILTPLRVTGASIKAHEGEYPPVTIRRRTLRPIRYRLAVASAQGKSAVILAALRAPGRTAGGRAAGDAQSIRDCPAPVWRRGHSGRPGRSRSLECPGWRPATCIFPATCPPLPFSLGPHCCCPDQD